MTTCPECGHPAEIEDRHVLESTDGPIEHAQVRCIARHWFFLPVAKVTSPTPGTLRPVARRRH